jgi:hypothetical protein
MSDEAAIKKALDALEAAKKKLGSGAGAEMAYAEAYKVLCRLDPVNYRPLKGKYR